MKHVRRILALLLVGVSIWLAYDNVYSDVTPTQSLAESTACGVKDCKLQHGLTKMSRSPLGQSFEFTWQSGVVHTACHREMYVWGAMRCVVE
jgi:hypothetical protein